MSVEEDFADLKFKLECRVLSLKQEGDGPLILRGPGEIWQKPDGSLQFKIYSDHEGYQTLLKYQKQPRVVGQIVPKSDYFRLLATDFNGTNWTAGHVYPSTRGSFDEGIVYGEIPELIVSEPDNPDATNDYVIVRFFGLIHFPCNQATYKLTHIGTEEREASSSLDVAIVEEGSFRFEFSHQGNHTVAALKMGLNEAKPATALRIQESFEFLLGEQLSVLVVETINSGISMTRFKSATVSETRGKLLPPLHFDRRDEGGHAWRMFGNYFKRIHIDTRPGLHPISRLVSRIIESKLASLETQVLSLGVGVEGLASECFADLAPVSADFITELNLVDEAIQHTKLNEKTLKRLTGTIDAMRRPRNSDVIHAFIQKSNLPIALYKSWKDLRNVSAHGKGAGQEDMATILQRRSEVLCLFYSMIFEAINYSGLRTDYSQRGWPSNSWPIKIST